MESLSTSESKIPCEFCDVLVYPSHYETHRGLCPKNPYVSNQNKAGVPCEVCSMEIPFDEYEKHFASHRVESNAQRPDSSERVRYYNPDRPRSNEPVRERQPIFETNSRNLFAQDDNDVGIFSNIRRIGQSQPNPQVPINPFAHLENTGMNSNIRRIGQTEPNPQIPTRPTFWESSEILRNDDEDTRIHIQSQSNQEGVDPMSALFSVLMGQRSGFSQSGSQPLRFVIERRARPEEPSQGMNVLDLLRTVLMAGPEDAEYRGNGGIDSMFQQMGLRRPEQGLKKEDLDRNFITAKYDEAKSANLDEEYKKCSICLADFEDGQELRFLACCHRFHSQCIDSWLENNTTCPICKKDFKDFNPDQI